MFSLLLIPLVAPLKELLVQNYNEIEVVNKQSLEVSQNQKIYHLVELLALHRGLSWNATMENRDNQRLHQLEIKIEKMLQTLKTKRLLEKTMLSKIQEIVSANKQKIEQREKIFDRHDSVIRALIATSKHRFQNAFYKEDESLYLYNDALIKLLTLQEYAGILQAKGSAILHNHQLSIPDKLTILDSYTQTKALLSDTLSPLLDARILAHHAQIKERYDLMQYQYQNIIHTVSHEMIVDAKDESSVNVDNFFAMTSDVLRTQSKLYDSIATGYRDELKKLKQIYEHRLHIFFLVLSLGLLVILYLAATVYYSVISGIRQLKEASKMIMQNERGGYIEINRSDEIATALHAFNEMKATLDENFSFLKSYKDAIDQASIVSKTNLKGIITYANDAFCEVSGYEREELIGKAHNIVRHPEMSAEVFKIMWETIRQGKAWQGIVKNRKKDGGYYITYAYVMPIVNHHDKIVEYIAMRNDITELYKSQEKIQEQLEQLKMDDLTKLYKREKLLEDIKTMKSPVLLYLNIDDFSSLNDFYGAQMGNEVLLSVTTLLQERFASTNYHIYKIEADGFVIMTEETSLGTSVDFLMDELISYVERYVQQCDKQECVSISMSGSFVLFDHTYEASALLSHLAVARKRAKDERKKYMEYHEGLCDKSSYQNNMLWINKIKVALENNRIESFFQPIIDNKSGEIHKYESLVRLIDTDGKVISPFFFLDIAKKAKLYTKITRVVFKKTFATFKDREDIEFSVNITYEDIIDKETSRFILESLENFPYPHNVILELTESEEIEDYEQVRVFIASCRALGARIAIDDFGSGYSNFDQVISMEADFLKVDGSLIKNIVTHKESEMITQAILAFAKSLGAKTIVEYVHNEAVYAKVKQMGADYSQGFYLGEPSAKLVDEAQKVVMLS